MKIGIDARWIFPEISGIGEYTRELITHLSEIDSVNSYTLFFNNSKVCARTIEETGIGSKDNFKVHMLKYGIFSPAGQLFLPRLLRKLDLDIFHSTNYMIPLKAFPPLRKKKPACIVTIHDVIPLIFPDHAPKSKKARIFPIYKRLMKEIGRRSDLIITDSDASGRDICKHLQIPESREEILNTVYCGVSPRFSPKTEPPSLDRARERNILYVGRSDPYKNIETLIKSLHAMKKSLPFPVRLTIAGSPDPRYKGTEMLADSLGIGNSITWTGYLSDRELSDLYRSADILMHASRYEGFGLQVVEAMASGTPVISSSAGSLDEVVADAGIKLQPDDVHGFTDAAIKVLTDPKLYREMSIKGIERAAFFTWRRTAEETLRLYRRAGA